MNNVFIMFIFTLAWKKMQSRKNSLESDDLSTGLFSSNCRPFSPRQIPSKNGVFGSQSVPQSNIFYSSISYNTNRSNSHLEALTEATIEEESSSGIKEEISNSNLIEDRKDIEEKSDSQNKYDLHTILEESIEEPGPEDCESNTDKKSDFPNSVSSEEKKKYGAFLFEQSKQDGEEEGRSGSDVYEEDVEDYESLSNEDDIEDSEKNFEVIALCSTSGSEQDNDRNSSVAESCQDDLDEDDFYDDDESNGSEGNIPQVDGVGDSCNRKRSFSSDLNFSFKKQRTQMSVS